MLETQIEARAAVSWIRLRGRLGSAETGGLEDELSRLLAGGERPLVFDLAELEYISSAGLRVFIATAKRLEGGRNHIAFLALQGMVREVFSISGFNKLFTICETESELGDFGAG